MLGTILHPLNTLKKSHPRIYHEEVKKYEGREELLTTEVLPLKCLWNDVLHFTAVSPHELKDNLAKAGLEYDEESWFKVPVERIQGEKSIAFIYRRDQGIIPDFQEYEVFDAKRMEAYCTVPPETITYYKKMKIEKDGPLLFHLVPHILYKGTLDTSDLAIITV